MIVLEMELGAFMDIGVKIINILGASYFFFLKDRQHLHTKGAVVVQVSGKAFK